MTVRAVLYPAIAEAARRAGARRIGLVDVAASAGPNLDVDRVGITYVEGPTLGDPAAAVQLTAVVRGDRPVPARSMPEVVARLHARVDSVAGAVALVPAGALPVVTTTWALSKVAARRRPGFLDRLAEAAATRPLAWVSVEGVGVAPSIPTLGDRPASGHSIVAVTLLDRADVEIEVVGRCWSRGRWLSWLAS